MQYMVQPYGYSYLRVFNISEAFLNGEADNMVGYSSRFECGSRKTAYDLLKPQISECLDTKDD